MSRSPHRCCLAPGITLGEGIGGWTSPSAAEPPREPEHGPANAREGSCRGGDTAPVCHLVLTPQMMLVRAGSVCHLPVPSSGSFQGNTATSPSCPPKLLQLFFGWEKNPNPPIFWLKLHFFSPGKAQPRGCVPAAAPSSWDGRPGGSAPVWCWGAGGDTPQQLGGDPGPRLGRCPCRQVTATSWRTAAAARWTSPCTRSRSPRGR